MTRLTSDELRKVGKTINDQFLNLKSKGKEEHVTLFGTNNFLIRSSSNQFILRLVGITDLGISEWPDWIDVTDDGKDTQISIPHLRTAELEFLLRKTWEDYCLDLTQPFHNSFLAQLKTQVKVWRLGSEHLDRDAQRGLIGEIEAVILCTEALSNNDAIDSWDETSKDNVDITHQDWAVEAKSKTPGSDTVKISSSIQLCPNQPLLLLSVTNISSDKKDGMTLPEWANKRLADLSVSVPTANIEKLRRKMDKIHQIFKMEEYFQSKWEVHDTKFFEIKPDSIPDVFGKNIPNGISIYGYTLDLKILNAEKIENIFSSI
jgi:hypothetical protein